MKGNIQSWGNIQVVSPSRARLHTSAAVSLCHAFAHVSCSSEIKFSVLALTSSQRRRNQNHTVSSKFDQAESETQNKCSPWICKVPSNFFSSGTYLSSCRGLTYPADKMLRERILGSMMVSSDSGVFRRRPGKAQVPQYQLIHGWWKVWFSGWRTKLTHNKLSDFLPFYVTSWFMHNSDSDSPLEALFMWRKDRWEQRKKKRSGSFEYFFNISKYYIWVTDIPGAVGMCHDKASLLCGQPLQGYS